MIHLLSLGAGVQSSTLALMAARGEVKGYPHPAGAIFADTMDEPASVYKWLDWLEAEIARSPHPFPVHRITAGKLSTRALAIGGTEVPVFTRSSEGEPGMVKQRSCTVDFKISPILKKARDLAAVPRKRKTGNVVHVTQWIGISLDEITRMKPSREWWAESQWPLVDMRMNRHDCKTWMKKAGYPEPPRSSCVFCPFHNNGEWRRLRDHEPEAWQQAITFEKRIQTAKAASQSFNTVPFLHRSLVPLAEVDLDTEEERGQGNLNLFENECEGMCGV